LAAMAMPAPQHAFALEPDVRQRPLRARVIEVGIRAQALESENAERQVRDQRLRLPVGASAPVAAAEPGADYCSPIAATQLSETRDSDRHAFEIDDQEVEALAPLALGTQPRDVGGRL